MQSSGRQQPGPRSAGFKLSCVLRLDCGDNALLFWTPTGFTLAVHWQVTQRVSGCVSQRRGLLPYVASSLLTADTISPEATGTPHHTTPHQAYCTRQGQPRQRHGLAAHQKYFTRCLDLTFEACRHEFPEEVLKGAVKRQGETVSVARRAWSLKQTQAGAQEVQTMRSDPRVGAISPADVPHVWVVRSVRRGAKLWLHAVPSPCPCHRSRAGARTRRA